MRGGRGGGRTRVRTEDEGSRGRDGGGCRNDRACDKGSEGFVGGFTCEGRFYGRRMP